EPMNPVKEVYYGYKLIKALAVAGITIAVLLADCLSGFTKIDRFGRWACIILGTLALASSAYYWRQINRKQSGRRRSRRHRHSDEQEFTTRNPPAKLPPLRE